MGSSSAQTSSTGLGKRSNLCAPAVGPALTERQLGSAPARARAEVGGFRRLQLSGTSRGFEFRSVADIWLSRMSGVQLYIASVGLAPSGFVHISSRRPQRSR